MTETLLVGSSYTPNPNPNTVTDPAPTISTLHGEKQFFLFSQLVDHTNRHTSREVNEARGGLMLAAGRVRSKT